MPASDPTTASPLDRHASPVGERASGSGRSTASLVLGIIGVLTFLIPIIGLILGIVAVVLAVTSRSDCARKSRPAPWQATAGLVLGALAIVASAAIILVAALS